MSKDNPGSTVKGCLLVQYAPLDNLVLFSSTKTKEKSSLAEQLQTYQGDLQADGNVSYEGIAQKNGIQLSNCLVHARGKFEIALDNDQERAAYVLSQIRRDIYAIEREIKQNKLDADAILTLRQTKSKPIMDSLYRWFTPEAPVLLPQSPMAKAIKYTTKRWEGLTQFLCKPHLLADNNLVENAIRPLALGRKNYLFAGSHDSAHRSAIMYSLLGTAKNE